MEEPGVRSYKGKGAHLFSTLVAPALAHQAIIATTNRYLCRQGRESIHNCSPESLGTLHFNVARSNLLTTISGRFSMQVVVVL